MKLFYFFYLVFKIVPCARLGEECGKTNVSHIGAGTNIFVRNPETGIYVKFSELPINERTKPLIGTIVAYYGNRVGFDGNVAVVDVPADKVDGSKPIMHSDQSTGTISINTNGGIYKALNDFNYLKNVIGHEVFHLLEGSQENYTYWKHYLVYAKQIESDNFKNVKQIEKIGTVAGAVQRLLNSYHQDAAKKEIKEHLIKTCKI